MIFLYDNLFDSATLTASTEDSSFPATNLQHSFKTKVWTTDNAGTANLVIDYGSATSVTAVVLIGYDWGSAPGTLDMEFNATDAWGAPSATEALTWVADPDAYGNVNVIIKTFSALNYRYNRLNVVHAPGDWNLGRIFIGNYFEPTRTYRDHYEYPIIDPSYIQQTVSGQKHVDEITKYRRKSVEFFIETYAQMRLFQTLFNNAGYGKDIFASFDYSNYPNNDTLYGKIVSSKISYKNLYWSATLTFEESR